jgi:hypothetical protein
MALGASAGCLLLLALLSSLGVVSAGPCGFDLFGSILLLGFLIGGGVGILLVSIGLLQKALRRRQF